MLVLSNCICPSDPTEWNSAPVQTDSLNPQPLCPLCKLTLHFILFSQDCIGHFTEWCGKMLTQECNQIFICLMSENSLFVVFLFPLVHRDLKISMHSQADHWFQAMATQHIGSHDGPNMARNQKGEEEAEVLQLLPRAKFLPRWPSAKGTAFSQQLHLRDKALSTMSWETFQI